MPLRIYFLLDSIEMSESLNLLALPLTLLYPKMNNAAAVSTVSAAASAAVAMCVKLCSTKFRHTFELTDLSLPKL